MRIQRHDTLGNRPDMTADVDAVSPLRRRREQEHTEGLALPYLESFQARQIKPGTIDCRFIFRGNNHRGIAGVQELRFYGKEVLRFQTERCCTETRVITSSFANR